jgi:hypothetical protein
MSASKTTFSHYNLNISTPKVTKNISNLLKKFCEFTACMPKAVRRMLMQLSPKINSLHICRVVNTHIDCLLIFLTIIFLKLNVTGKRNNISNYFDFACSLLLFLIFSLVTKYKLGITLFLIFFGM